MIARDCQISAVTSPGSEFLLLEVREVTAVNQSVFHYKDDL